VNKYKSFLILLLLFLFPLFFVFGPDYYSARSYRAAWNLGHILFFSIATYLLITSRFFIAKSFLQQFLVAVGLSLVVGIAIELIQGSIERESDILDIFRNELGVLLALFWFSPVCLSLNGWDLKAGRAVLVVVLIAQIYFPLQLFVAERRATEAFPVLADFEETAELSRWRGNSQLSISNDNVSNGSSSLKVEFGTEKYSGLGLVYFPRDWQGYKTLQFDVYNSQLDELKITVRIHDQLHREGEQLFSDRFNRRFQLQHGWNTVSISLAEVERAPDSRLMDMTLIAGVGIFVTGEKVNKIAYLDSVKLQ
jgi:VanZ family protein